MDVANLGALLQPDEVVVSGIYAFVRAMIKGCFGFVPKVEFQKKRSRVDFYFKVYPLPDKISDHALRQKIFRYKINFYETQNSVPGSLRPIRPHWTKAFSVG
ncbi:hypothetical protein BCON_0005g00880 [Botryotinia convoluta]|uniref:Uncharacterized protein n=1 Tax=Botryotinia convoluta TaxID=54673 RepID=A0A4Z1J005_9HELO|nr:hypothetical protein BCON_0005g00880 [Botryotinia convoluta]